MSSKIIECISLCKYFKGRSQITKAVDDVSLSIDRNECILIKGRSGSGKSTLLSLMSGLDKPTHGSLGQQQKVAIARTLAKEPSIIFADEPTGSVDDQTAREIIQHLLFLKNEKKVTLIITSHGNSFDDIADRIVFMHAGLSKCIHNVNERSLTI